MLTVQWTALCSTRKVTKVQAAASWIPSTVLVNGRIAYRDGDLRVEPGSGRFLERRVPA